MRLALVTEIMKSKKIPGEHMPQALGELSDKFMDRGAPVVGSHEPPDPVNVGFLRSVTVVLEANSLPDRFQQHGFFRHHHVSYFLIAIYVPLSQGMVGLIQWITKIQPGIHDRTAAETLDTSGVH